MNTIEAQRAPRSSWSVLSDYRVEGDKLVGVPPVVRTYDPLDSKELPGEIARLKPGDKKGLREFALRYGSFGYAELVNAVEEYAPDPDLLFDPSEPIDWIWAHARAVRLVLDGIRILQEHDEEKAVKYLAGLSRPYSDLSELARGDVVIHGATPQVGTAAVYEAIIGHRQLILAQRWIMPVSWVRPFPMVGDIVGDILTANLALTHREAFYCAERAAIRSTFMYDAMIQAVYQQLLETAEGGRVKQCEECHGLFIQTDGRQNFCPPRFRERESRCALRYRQRKWRERRKQEGGSEDGQT